MHFDVFCMEFMTVSSDIKNKLDVQFTVEIFSLDSSCLRKSLVNF